MKAINVLRDNRRELSAFLEFYDCMMDGVGLGITKAVPSFEFVVPMLNPCRLRGHEVLVVNRLPARPHALRSPKVRDTAAGRNAGTRKDHDLFGGADVFSQVHGLR